MIDSGSVKDYGNGYVPSENTGNSILRKSGTANGTLLPIPPPPPAIVFQLSDYPSDVVESPSRKKKCHWSVDTEPAVEAKISADMTSYNSASADDVSVAVSQHMEENNKSEARDSLIALLSALYALVLIIFALTTELSAVLHAQRNRGIPWIYELYHIYLYGAALAFFVHCYGFLLHRGWIRTLRQSESALRTRLSKVRLGEMRDDLLRSARSRKISLASVSYNGPTAGSLYLRLGCIVFGIVSIVSVSLELLKCVDNDFFNGGANVDERCGPLRKLKLWMSIIFVFMQMHFVFQNSKMTIHRSKNVGRFGTMHLIAVNLWVWFRHLILEEFEVSKEIDHAHAKVPASIDFNFTTAQSDEEGHHRSHRSAELLEELVSSPCGANRELCFMRETFAPMLNTCTIEYSLIAAGVMFVLWRNIGTMPRPEKHTSRKQHLRVDCSSSTTGLFVGLIFLVATFISLIIFYTKIHADRDEEALWVFGLTDAVLYLVSISACVLGIWRTRKLSYETERHASGAKLLEDILLIVGLIGQLLFCISGIVGISSTNQEKKIPGALKAVLAAHVMRLVQVLLQTVFILSASRLAATTSIFQRTKPGREVVTFLMVVNMALFLVGTFEGQKSSVNQALIEFYGQQAWAFVAQSTIPLSIFYRFHSSVCLVEIWKHSYRVRVHYV